MSVCSDFFDMIHQMMTAGIIISPASKTKDEIREQRLHRIKKNIHYRWKGNLGKEKER